MLVSEANSEDETLLVYLPCYLDFGMAIAQAGKIRNLEKLKSPKIRLKVQIMFSCNGVELTSEDRQQIEKLSDHVNLLAFGISGDINITQGFMHAMRLQADYLWILSSNDTVSDEFIQTIFDGLIQQREANILVGCTSGKLGIRKISSVFDTKNRDVPFGLISSVVYRTKDMEKNFDSAIQMNWTGWGQLAAIESSCIALDGITASLVNESALYVRSTRTLDNIEDEKNRIRNGYAHSFFGMPVVISTLHAANPKKRKKYLNSWIISNWYLVNYFLGTNYKLWSSHIASNQIWLRKFAFAAIRNASLSHRTIFTLSRFVNLSAISEYKAAKMIRQILKN